MLSTESYRQMRKFSLCLQIIYIWHEKRKYDEIHPILDNLVCVRKASIWLYIYAIREA